MAAEVIAYPAFEDDETLTLKIVCYACDSEWGWRMDTPTGYARLEDLADLHNREVHGWKPLRVRSVR